MITQAICNSFKQELLGGVHDFDTDTFKMALFAATASVSGTHGAASTNYSDMGADEVTGTGYTAGGVTLTGATIVADGVTSYVDFADFTIEDVTLTTRGAMIYNASKANRAVAIWDFGTDKVLTAGNLSIQFPSPDASNALLRLS